MFQILKTRQNFTLRWLLDLRNNSLWQNLRLSTLDYLFFIPAIFYLLFRCSVAIIEGAVSLTWCWLLHLGYGFLVARRLEGIGPLLLTECLLGFDHSDITHLLSHPKLQKVLFPDLHPVFPKCGNAPNAQNSYSLTL